MSAAVLQGEAWHAARSRVVGGSEVAALFDVQPDYAMSLYALWHVKAGNVPPPRFENERVAWGLRLEDAIAEGAAEQEGWTIRKGGHVLDPTTPGLGCTLDYIIEGDEPGALEIKNADWLAHKRDWIGDEPPMHILLQLQHQLAATGYTWGAVACLVGGNQLRIYEYKARPKLIADIRRRVAEFWQSIDEGREPPIDGSAGASAVLRALYPDTTPEIADLSADNELPGICAEYIAHGHARRQAEAAEAEAKNRLIGKLGAHQHALAQGYRISVAVTPAKPDRPARPDEIIKGRAESRRYTVKEFSL